ncbi:complexin-like [Paramacrobiotus metropolitanus]|uniref:complexin-like n=1 Tax=Paramacrobiotus metropolitanus TaxID=2943436 RepID=UPI002445C2C8|nr:complexin-like [Paramacrobiotus metropolitanus]
MEFMAKQMLSSKMGEVKKLTGEGDGEKKEEGGATAEEEAELMKMREEAEFARKEKHRKMEEQREGMRQGIRDKYGIKKKEIIVEPEPAAMPGMEGRLNKPKADQALLAQQAAMADEDLPLMKQVENGVNYVKEAATGLFAKLPFFK